MNATETELIEQLLRDAPLPLIAARIKRARKTAGVNGGPITHDQLGERTGMYRQNLIGLEQGKHRPRIKTLIKIAEATDRDPRWFVDPEVDPSPFQLGEEAA
jgi:transcriptional regulator with XRE-family HTH domain